MKKSNVINIVLIPILTLSVLSIAPVYIYNQDNQKFEIKYSEEIKKAEKLEKKKIYLEAYDTYKKIASNTDEFKYHHKVAELALITGKINDYEKKMLFILEKYPKIKQNYEELINYAKEYNKTSLLMDTFRKKKVEFPKDDYKEFDELLLSYTENPFSYEYVADYIGKYAVFKDNAYGLLKERYDVIIEPQYEYISGYSEELDMITTLSENTWSLMGLDGFRRAVSDDALEFLGVYSNDYVRAKKEGKWYFYNKKLIRKSKGYDEVSNFKNNVAAVKENGKWYLIDKKFKKISDKFDDILIDFNGFFNTSGMYIVKENSKYVLYNKDNKKVSKDYDYIDIPNENQYIAFKKGNKWGYINTEGKEIVPPKYEDAKSFNLGRGVVKKDGKIYLITENFAKEIEVPFKELSGFNSSGMAIYKKDVVEEVENKETKKKEEQIKEVVGYICLDEYKN